MHFLVSPFVLLIAIAIYRLLSFVINKFLWNRLSIVKDIYLLSRTRPTNEKLQGTAIICGGSFAGLFTARVCANHFEKVLIIEPEEWVATGKGKFPTPESPKRSRVAQYGVYHHFRLIVTSAMKEMFGSQTLEKSIQSLGGRLTLCSNVYWMSGFPMLIPSGFPYHSGNIYPSTISMARPSFETMLRRLVLQTCNEVKYFHGTVVGLVHDQATNRVTGVNVRLPNGDSTELKGSLVIDATGSFMGGFRWLKALPKFSNSRLDDLKLTFDPKVSYTNIEFTLPPNVEEDFRKYGLPTDADADSKQYASMPMDGVNDNLFVIEKREKNLLQMGCGGYNWSGKIRSVSDIEEFVRQLKLKQPLPEWIYDLLHTLQSEDVPATFVDSKFPLAVHIKYSELNDIPSNFIVVGDSQSQTDPIFGQGCPKICANAIILNYHLHQIKSTGPLPPTFANTFLLDVQTRTEHIWTSMKLIDYNFPTTIPIAGENVETTSWFMRTYSNILMVLAAKDADVSGVFYRQVGWLEPATATFAPWIIRRVCWAWIKQYFGYEIL